MIEFLIVFLPLFGSLFVGCFVRFRQSFFLQMLPTFLVLCSAALSWYLFFNINGHYDIRLFPWINCGNFSSYITLSIDKLSALMFVVVNTVSFVVHIYSIGYMEDQTSKSRYFAYLSLFTFAMLLLVSSADFLQLFLGWEGVGLCSYLLIGFWFQKQSANLASLKAFIVNRVGDFSFLIGIFAIYKSFGTINFKELFFVGNNIESTILGINALDLICFTLFIGCMGKSAQIGLHTWLPDAMEGPTPVSALIHAATMVTAGVFLVVKVSFLFEYSVYARQFIIVIGALTAIFAASIAVFQTDIKKIIAYSTCSQLGYMFVACGVSAYGVAMFHLATHAFFKALLFLCAGNIIHAAHGKQDIDKISGISIAKMPVTFAMMLIASLALCGIMPFAGFYSKDLIIEASYSHSLIFYTLIFAAFLTSVYSFKIISAVFFRARDKKDFVVHALSKKMVFPPIILAFLSVFSGFYSERFLHITESSFWYETSVVIREIAKLHGLIHFAPLIFASIGIAFVCLNRIFAGDAQVLKSRLFCGLFISCLAILSFKLFVFSAVIYLIFLLSKHIGLKALGLILQLPKKKYYFDEFYNKFLVQNMCFASCFLWRVVDVVYIDFLPNALAYFSAGCSRVSAKFQTGYIYHYALLMILGILLLYVTL